ncbi:MAG: alpha/beta fold hydrolase [Gammaproteobacteria bacterium]|nr:alpha/beta fold hydrolase [Gammaproteobacteria bacterium]MDE0248964.1 alpha/beta fold hydrolase [Gammaproteobacteria bacterium]
MRISEPAPDAPPRPHAGFQPASFTPPPWLRGGHAQTVAGKFLRAAPALALEPLRVPTPDGDFLDLEVGPEPAPQAPVVLLLHGLEGSTRRGYMRQAMLALLEAGVRPVGMNFRACSGTPNLRPRFYHSGDTGDLRHVLATLRKRMHGRAFGAIGFSLGGNVLLRYLAEAGTAAPRSLGAAVAVSVPYDLAAAARMLEAGGMGRFYTRYFLKSLRAKVRAKRALLESAVDVERVLTARTLWDYDEAATAPLHGFRDAADYYKQVSSGPVLGDVRVPTLLIHAADDPFLPADAVPVAAVERNPWLLGAFTRRGGHVGFIPAGAVPRRQPFWAETEAAHYLSRLLGGAAVSRPIGSG